MSGKKIIYYLITAFVAGNFLLIFIQYNSAKNIYKLINGNERVLAEINVTNNLRDLNKDISSIDSNTNRSLFLHDSSIGRKELEQKISKMQSEIDHLQRISDDDTSVAYIDVLDTLVHEKLFFSKNLLSNNLLKNNNDAEKIKVNAKTRQFNDSIRLVTDVIENSRHKLLAQITATIDKSGKNALSLGVVLIVLVLISGAILFWFIVTAMRRQNQLINRLNISEKKERETAGIKEKFMANMSHEIRTPMTAILGFTYLLINSNLDEDSKKYVQAIHRSGESLLAIINDILDLSKIEAGMMRIEMVPFDIRVLVNSIETMFKTKMDEKKLKFFIKIDDLIPDKIVGDPTRLTQVLINLLGNAIKFTNKGNITLKLSSEGIFDDTIKIGITVSDTGIGIAKEKMPYIFNRFQQAEDSVTRQFGGTGLGLAIVNDLIKLQNGKIEIQSEEGRGTTLNLVIPYKVVPEKTVVLTTVENFVKADGDFKDKIILVVEDNAINQTLIGHLFKTWKLNFDLAGNGTEAIKKLQLKRYDLILMDIQMPEMGGYEATEEIRKGLKCDTPIIAMTAHAFRGERQKCLSHGMNEYISKPIRENELHSLIVKFLKTSLPEINKTGLLSFKESSYNYINLHYMQEISGGNINYEKAVTEQFIEAIPDDLEAIESAWRYKNFIQIKQLAHYIKPTISIMGLDNKLESCLDSLEHEYLSEDIFNRNFATLKTVCLASIQEAKHFYSTL